MRLGAAYVALRADGRVLLRARPEKGLLGAMTEVPGSAWAHDFDVKHGAALRAALGREDEMAQAARPRAPRVHAFSA